MSDPKRILLVDRNTRNLEILGDFLTKQGFSNTQATSEAELEQSIESSDGISLALIDISGFGSKIWEYCRRLNEKNIPFIVISPKESAAIKEESRASGADEVLTKPLVAKELAGLIKNMIGE